MKKYSLMIGDTVALFLITLIGFVSHGEGNLSFLPRFLAAFVPITITWLGISPRFGLSQPEIASNPRQFWRVLFAMIFVAPLAAVFRGLILKTAVLPSFVVVFGVTSAVGVLIWRGIYWLINRKTPAR